jgi:hypothetical protein
LIGTKPKTKKPSERAAFLLCGFGGNVECGVCTGQQKTARNQAVDWFFSDEMAP